MIAKHLQDWNVKAQILQNNSVQSIIIENMDAKH